MILWLIEPFGKQRRNFALANAPLGKSNYRFQTHPVSVADEFESALNL